IFAAWISPEPRHHLLRGCALPRLKVLSRRRRRAKPRLTDDRGSRTRVSAERPSMGRFAVENGIRASGSLPGPRRSHYRDSDRDETAKGEEAFRTADYRTAGRPSPKWATAGGWPELPTHRCSRRGYRRISRASGSGYRGGESTVDLGATEDEEGWK